MNIKKFTRQKLERSADEAKHFWAGVKNRLSRKDACFVIEMD